MSEIKTEKPKKTKKRLSRSALVLIIGLFIIAVPIIIFLSILGISAMQAGTPREGSRFDGDLKPEITKDQVSTLQSDLESIGQLDSVEIKLAQGQLRIYIDTNDSLSEEQVDSIITSAYNKVNSLLPVNTYFTSTESSKMYDLSINVYTQVEASEIGSSNSRQYKLLHKNSTESQYEIEDLAHPKNPELAAELEGLTPSGEESESEETTSN